MDESWPTSEETQRIFRSAKASEKIREPPLKNGTLKQVIIDNFHLLPEKSRRRLLNYPNGLINEDDKDKFGLRML